MDLGLKGKTAVVTGGSKGIGHGLQRPSWKRGQCFICARNVDEVDAAVRAREQGTAGAAVSDGMADGHAAASDGRRSRLAPQAIRYMERYRNSIWNRRRHDGGGRCLQVAKKLMAVWTLDCWINNVGPLKRGKIQEQDIEKITKVCFFSTIYGTRQLT